MENALKFKAKIHAGQVCIGTAITLADPIITEALCQVFDFIWIDMEHNPLTIETVQSHIMATRGTDVMPMVRVAWNDPVLIKPVLDIGAAAVVVPLVRTADDVRRAVEGCLYPPDGMRGFGPRRPNLFGQIDGPTFCRMANETLLVMAQIEHIDAVRNLDEILAVPGLGSILVGPNDLSGSMGLMAQARHPDVLRVIQTVIDRCRERGMMVGVAIGDHDPMILREWIDRGINWISVGCDWTHMLDSSRRVAAAIRDYAPGTPESLQVS